MGTLTFEDVRPDVAAVLSGRAYPGDTCQRAQAAAARFFSIVARDGTDGFCRRQGGVAVGHEYIRYGALSGIVARSSTGMGGRYVRSAPSRPYGRLGGQQ